MDDFLFYILYLLIESKQYKKTLGYKLHVANWTWLIKEQNPRGVTWIMSFMQNMQV